MLRRIEEFTARDNDPNGGSRSSWRFVVKAANDHSFTSDQVRRIVAELSFEDDHKKALQALQPKITDPKNKEVILDAIEEDDEKARVRKLLKL